MYKLSKYNIVDINSDGHPYVYNALSKQCELISDKVYGELKKGRCSQLNYREKELLYEKGFLVTNHIEEEDIVEYRRNTEIHNQKVLDLTFIMTHACNLKCVYCYQETGSRVIFSDDVELRVIRFVETKIKDGVKKVYINWFGGEPLIEIERILSMGRKIYELCRKYKVATIGRITTNGYLLTADTLMELLKIKVVYYMVTIDGPKQLHDSQRPHKSGRGSYDVIINNLLEIKRLSKVFYIDVRVNISHENASFMDEFMDEYLQLFGDNDRFNIVFEAVHDWRGERISQHKDLVVDNSEVVREIYNNASKKGIALRNYLNYFSEVQICSAIKKNGFVITGDGNLHKCEMAMNDDVFCNESNIGFIDEDGNPVIDKKKEIKWTTRSKNLDKCYDCVAYPYCMGGAQCNYGMKFHNQLRCDDNVSYLHWTSELLSKGKRGILC